MWWKCTWLFLMLLKKNISSTSKLKLTQTTLVDARRTKITQKKSSEIDSDRLYTILSKRRKPLLNAHLPGLLLLSKLDFQHLLQHHCSLPNQLNEIILYFFASIDLPCFDGPLYLLSFLYFVTKEKNLVIEPTPKLKSCELLLLEKNNCGTH